MAQPAPVTTEDRLPWLTEVPRTPPPPKKKRRRFPWEWVVAALIVGLVGAAAWWLAIRQPPQDVQEPVGLDANSIQAIPSEELEVPSVSDMTADSELAVEPVTEETEQAAERQPQRRTAPARERQADTSTETNAESANAETVPVVSLPQQPVVRGRIIQIGAYPTRERADEAWKYVVRRWPYLAGKPKLVSPIEVRSTDGKSTRMFRLQLATSSQAQSAVICQRLETAKVSCVVVY